jgi:hypothetical protein
LQPLTKLVLQWYSRVCVTSVINTPKSLFYAML